MTHKITDYISIAEGATRSSYSKQQLSKLCRQKILESIYLGNRWLILASSLDSYAGQKPGLKKGQKINRLKKNEK
jgi:hypothetical protein